MKKCLIFALILILFLLIGSALAMSSDNYALDWFTLLTSGGGGVASSANYAANVTIGQTAIGDASSANYGTDLGYWYEEVLAWSVHLPIVIR